MIAVDDDLTPFLDEAKRTSYRRKYTTNTLQKNYTAKFNELLNKTGKDLTPAQVQSILSQWNSADPESIAAQVSDEFGKSLKDTLDKYITSAGFQARFEAGFSGKDKSISNSDVKDFFLTEITNYMSNYANIIYSSGIQEDLALLKSMEAGKTIANLKFNGTRTWTNENIALLANSADKSLNRLAEIIKWLQATTKTSLKSNSGNEVENPYQLIRMLGGIFDKIGGEKIMEPAAVHIGQSVGAVVPKMAIEQSKGLSGGQITFKWNEATTAATGQGAISGKEIKPDYTISYNFNNGNGTVAIELPVSMKIRKSQQFLKGTQAMGQGYTSFGGAVNFETVLRVVAGDMNVKALEEGWGAVYHRGEDGDLEPTTSDEYSDYENSWSKILQDVKIHIAQRALLGSLKDIELNGGGNQADMIAVVHVNDKFISTYDIITRMNDPEFIKWANAKGSSYADRPFRDYVPLKATQKAGWESKEDRLSYVKKNIEDLYSRQIAVYLNIGSLL